MIEKSYGLMHGTCFLSLLHLVFESPPSPTSLYIALHHGPYTIIHRFYFPHIDTPSMILLHYTQIPIAWDPRVNKLSLR